MPFAVLRTYDPALETVITASLLRSTLRAYDSIGHPALGPDHRGVAPTKHAMHVQFQWPIIMEDVTGVQNAGDEYQVSKISRPRRLHRANGGYSHDGSDSNRTRLTSDETVCERAATSRLRISEGWRQRIRVYAGRTTQTAWATPES